MKVRDYETIRMNDGGEVRVWYDGVIDVLKESHMTVGFSMAAKRLRSSEAVERDAARYRWLRAEFAAGRETYIGECMSKESETDAYIDTCMQQSSSPSTS